MGRLAGCWVMPIQEDLDVAAGDDADAGGAPVEWALRFALPLALVLGFQLLASWYLVCFRIHASRNGQANITNTMNPMLSTAAVPLNSLSQRKAT